MHFINIVVDIQNSVEYEYISMGQPRVHISVPP